MTDTLQLLLDSLPFLLKGAIWTVVLSLGGMFFGLLLGFGLALLRPVQPYDPCCQHVLLDDIGQVVGGGLGAACQPVQTF